MRSFYRHFGKRLLDLAITVPAMIALCPVIALVALLVRIILGSPILYSAHRGGLNGRIFTIYKFRSMRDLRDAEGRLLPDEKRLTRFGNFIRRVSLDELPQLWNVLKGEMSLVGPRPLMAEYLDYYSPEQARRHEVRPGITGWAQVNGRNAIAWERKFELDVWYVDHLSFWLDVKIAAMTILKVFSDKDISAEGHATMPKFTGTKANLL